MKRNLKLKTLLISTAIASSIIMPVTTYQALSKSNFDNIFSDSTTEIKKTKSKTTDERSQGDFQIEKAAVGSASTAIAANVLGVEHVFLWGENSYGTLGVGETAEGQPSWGSITSKVNEYGPYPNNLKPNTTPLLEAPEDVNIDGGASGIQGKVVNMSFGKFTSYIAIQPDDGSSIVVYSAGANWNGEQGQGVGSTKDSVDGENSWPYNSKFTPITFYNDDNTEIGIKEILWLEAGDVSTFISFVDDAGANRVFSWGNNNSGQLGAGINSNGKWGDLPIEEPGNNAIDRPVEITNGFDIPTYTGDIVEGADSTTALDWYFSDENVGGSQNKPEFYSSLPKGVSALEGDNIPYSKDHTTDATRTPEYTYPFDTQKLPDTDWQIVKISSAPDSTLFEAQSKSTGKSALYYAGDTVYKGTWFLQKNFNWDDSVVPDKDGAPKNERQLMSYRPALFMFDGMSPDLFINRDSATTNTDYVDATNIQIKDFIINMYNIILVLNIDGKDHLFTSGSDKSYFTGIEGFLGGGTMVQDTIGGINRAIYEPNLGWDEGTTIGIPDGGEILQIFATNATLGALIKTKDEQDNSKDVYSIITWGDNGDRLVSPDDVGKTSGKGFNYIETPTLRLTTAASKDSYASTYSAFPTTINERALFISKWLMDYRLETNLYDENANYVISDVVTRSGNLAFTVSDGKGNSYEYFIGSNEEKQISSNANQIDKNSRGGYFYVPTQLQFGVIPVSDSFKLDNYTTTIEGVDFSMNIISGAEMESFLPSSVDGSMVLYGDINKDGKTDDDEAFGTGKDIPAPNLGSDVKINSGKVEYIGRGVKANEADPEPTYKMSDIPETDQKNSIHNETYHFRISGLNQGANFDNLKVSANKHHPVPVDGVLQTKQSAKVNPDTIVITNKNTDYITVELEILHGVPGYDELKVPTNSTHDGDYEVNIEPTAEDFEHVLKIYVGADISDNEEVGTVSDLEILSPHPKDQDTQIGVEPIGTKVRFNLTGLDENTKYENMYTFFEGQGSDIWNYRSLPGATFTTSSALQLNGFTLDQTSIDDKLFKFTLDIKQGTVIEGGKKVDYQKLDTDNVTLTVTENHGGAGEITTTPVATYIPETDSESKGLYHFSVEGLQPNTVYTIKDITINEENTKVSSHTMGSATFSPSSDNTFTTAALPNELDKIENVNFEAGSEDGKDAPQLSFDMSIKSGGDYQTIDWDSSNTDGLAFKAKASRLGSGAGDIDLSKTSWTSTTPPVTDSTGTVQTSTITFNLENNTKYSDIKYSLDGGTTWTAAPTLDKEYSTIGITPLFTKNSFEPAEEGPNPDFARVKFDFTTGGQYGDIDKDKISFTIKDEDGTTDVPNIDKEYISGDNASGTSEEEVEWIYKVKGLQPNTKYTSLSLYYDGVLQDTAEIAEIQTTPEAIELTDFVTTSRVADVSVVDGTSDPIYNMDATVHIKSGGTSYDLNGSETVKFTDQNGHEIEGTITPQSVGPKASSIVEQDYDIHVDGLNGNNSYTMNVMTTPTDGPNARKSVMASEPYNIGKHLMHSDSPVGNISVDVIDGTSVNLNYEVLDNTNPEMDGAFVDKVLLNTVPLTTTPGTRTLEKQIELETTIGKHTLEIDHLITNETYSDWSITVQWHGDVFSKVAMETTITIDPFTVETPPTPFPWWIVILILILLLLLILILLLLWLLNRNVFVTGTVDAEKGKVRFSINRDRRSEFDKLIEGRTLTAINENGIRQEYKYSLADAELNEIIIEVQGINNEINLTNIIFRKDEALNEKISAEYEKVLAKYESSLEAWTNKKDQAKENGEEFTEDKPAKPSKPKLSKDIKVIGKVDTEILPVFEGKEPKDYEEAKKSKRYVKRKLGYQKLRKKSSAKVVKKSDVAAERNKGNKIFTDSIRKIESAQVLLAEAEAFEKKLKKKITATARTL